MKSMTQCMRWYGHKDVVTLQDIRQAGCTGVVTALHQNLPGEIWALEEIVEFKEYIESHGLTWEVVESLPVHDHIKLGYDDRNALIENYLFSIKNLAHAGIKVITYNFMLLLDWLRTDVNFKNEDGSEILYFKQDEYAVFDLFMLKRQGAQRDYSTAEQIRLKQYYDSLEQSEIQRIIENFLLPLPGDDLHFDMELLKTKIEAYSKLTRRKLKENLVYFLERICPETDKLGIRLAVHPDDPPYPVFGLPRIVSTPEDCSFLFESVPNPSNGLCFCTGTFGSRKDNDLVEMTRMFGSRINFLHLRNTKILDNGDFYEANHLEGNADMFGIIKQVIQLMQNEDRSIPMRPDHGPIIMDDRYKKALPGYSGIGRMKGLAELRGVEYAIMASMRE